MTRSTSASKKLETGLERLIFASRWLMAPMYLGLVFALGILLIVFAREVIHVVPLAFSMKGEDAILIVLTLIDLTLAANLLLIVLFSGYENFVSKFDFDTGGDRPDWMGTVDFSGLKMKLIASIVAISAIDLLKWFMGIEEYQSGPEMDSKLMWLVIIHLTFVVSGAILAYMDWLAAKSKPS